MNLIKREKDLDKVKLAEIEYALDGMYRTLSKTIIILFVAYLIGHLKDTIIFMLFYIPIRSFSFGFHANSSIVCLIFSLISFLFLPWIFSGLLIPFAIKITLYIICLIVFIIFSPSSTKKRKIKNKEKRIRLKIISSLITVIYFIISLFVNSRTGNIILCTLLFQSLMISPIIYYLFH